MTDQFDPLEPEQVRSLLSSAAFGGASQGADILSTLQAGAARRIRNRRILTGAASVVILAVAVAVGYGLRPDNNASVRPDPVATDGGITSSSPSPTAQPRLGYLPKDLYPSAISSWNNFWFITGERYGLSGFSPGQDFKKIVLPAGWQSASGAGAQRGISQRDSANGVLWFGSQIWTSPDVTKSGSWMPLDRSMITGDVLNSARALGQTYLLMGGPCRETFPIQCTASLLSFGGGNPSGVVKYDVSLPPGEMPRAVTAAGNDVWILSLTGGGDAGHLLHSNNFGATFTALPTKAGCLSGSLSATSATTVWLYCTTGTLGHPEVSTDGGKTFRAVNSPQGSSNQSALLAIDGNVALITTDTGIQRTSNQGETWTRVPQPAGIPRQFFDGAESLFALVAPASGQGGDDLWLSSDEGGTWKVIPRNPS